MISRTYGWVQNPSDFKKLKLVVQIFDPTSEHYKKLKTDLVPKYIPLQDIKNQLLTKLNSSCSDFSYTELVGTTKNKDGEIAKKRKEAIADGLIQVTILPQSYKTSGKMWTDNWTADGYLRWALSLNFVQHDRNNDICKITDLGKRFSSSENSSLEEENILKTALLSYPPAFQVLKILSNSKTPVSKFYIGNHLGFCGEKGFTSYDESLMTEWFKTGTVEEQKKIKRDIEGTSDKYARMICNWLEKIDLVAKQSTRVKTINGEKAGFLKYYITGKGKHAFMQADGSSKNSKIIKFFTWEFLATDGKNKNYVRSRRAYILKHLKKTTSFDKLIDNLRNLGFNDSIEIIENDIDGLNNFGIQIEKNDNSIVLRDNFYDFTIPILNLTEELKDNETNKLKSDFLQRTGLPMKYIELLDIATDSNRNRDFEIITAELFKNVYGLDAMHLGGGRKPDGIVYTNNFGIIVDTKAYSNGYSKSMSEEDKMVRYIEDNKLRDTNINSTEWWKNFNPNIPNNSFYFLWVSSKFIGKFNEQLANTHNRTSTNGGALNVEQLLMGAYKVKKGDLSVQEIPFYFLNKEIFWK